jgi:hypothetical protein
LLQTFKKIYRFEFKLEKNWNKFPGVDLDLF